MFSGGAIFAGAVFLVCGVLAYLMLKDSPQRFPKLAVVLAAISGAGFTGWALATFASVATWVDTRVTAWFGFPLVTVIFLVFLYQVGNHLMPNLGSRVQGGSVKTADAVKGFLLVPLGLLAGGVIATGVAELLRGGGAILADLSAGWF